MPTTQLSAGDLLFGDFSAEYASTRRVLERYPDGRGTWRPHEKSRTVSELATHLADLPNRGVTVLQTEVFDVGTRAPVAPMDSAKDLLAHFEGAVRNLAAAVAAADFDHLEKPWTIRAGGKVLTQQPRRVMMRIMGMSHLVHHRAQLGVYYRLMGIPVPGIYGPSADD
ncbi:MAG TPA: DinB family protein [Gemmatimonadaceae bacterium]|nr:DinB family protein [Gemmatimonadaceae bacterium]